MSIASDPQHLTLEEIAQRCAQETKRYRQGESYDPQYCFELFRRAILERDQSAWEMIYVQYQWLVEGWVKRHSTFEASGEESQYFVNRAFEKIWATLSREQFGRVLNLPALLGYLKTCVNSVIVDHNRMAGQASLYASVEEPSAPIAEDGPYSPAIEEQVFDRTFRQAFWDWINSRLHNETERQVVYGSFILGLKPRELYDQFRNMFSEVDEVYRIKQNVLARLGRDPEFRKFIGGDD